MNKMIYHYTSAQGLIGILGCNSIDEISIRATDVRFLNDKLELSIGIEEIKVMKQSETLKSEWNSFINDIEMLINESLIFITSFCENKDSLSQWIAYCPGGGGYCIEFDSSKIGISTFDSSTANLQLSVGTIDYNGSILREKVSKYFANYLKYRSNTTIKQVQVYNSIVAAAMRKHHGFNIENEIRLVGFIFDKSKEYEQIKFIEKSNKLVPYIDIKLPKYFVTSVIIDPRLNFEQEKVGLELFKNKFNYHFEIEKSNIPFR